MKTKSVKFIYEQKPLRGWLFEQEEDIFGGEEEAPAPDETEAEVTPDEGAAEGEGEG